MDSEGHRFLVLEYISGCQSYVTSVAVSGEFIISPGGNKDPNKTTIGWELLTQISEGF